MSRLKEWIKIFPERWKNADKSKKRKSIILVIVGIALLMILICVLLLVARNAKRENVVYKEAKAEVGLLAAGVTETGSVDVGTTTQSFELDISQFTGESNFDFGSGAVGMSGMPGMDMMGEVMGGSQSASSTDSSRILEIEEVYVKAGEEITEGMPLLKLTQASVESIRGLLAEDVTSAQLVYEQTVTAGKQTAVEAQSAYDTNVLYGEYYQAEYEQTMKTLQEEVDQKQEALTEAQDTLTEAQEDLVTKQSLLTEQKKVLENAQYEVDTTEERENLYWWIMAWQTKESAQTMVETLEEEIQTLEESIKEYEEAIADANTQLSLAQKAYESGKVQAENQLEIRTFKAENAQEIYDVAIEQGDFDTGKASEDYEEAKAKLEEFDAQVVEQNVLATSNGLITDVYVAAGDTLSQNTDIISMNDYDAVTVTLSIEEDDMEAAQVGNQVNVTIAAFSEEVFKGEVTEIGDAEIDSNTNKTLYSVTVTIQNTGNIFYQDMTAEVTFLTEESAEVLYVPSRTIMQEGEKTYVKVKDDMGDIIVREVVTGISDGVNTEIKEGLSEGETVLWESKVKQS